jgi:hypothetical protein
MAGYILTRSFLSRQVMANRHKVNICNKLGEEMGLINSSSLVGFGRDACAEVFGELVNSCGPDCFLTSLDKDERILRSR